MGNPNQPRDDKGRWKKVSGVALVGTIAVSIGIATGGSSGTSASSGSKGDGARSSKSQAKAKDRDITQIVRRLTNNDLRVEQIATSTDSDCARNSYGRVRVYLADHPCSALFRALLRVTDRNRAVAVVAVATVDMPDAGQARSLQSTMDEYGTGNVTELRSPRVPAVRWTGQYYTSSRADFTVVNAQAEPVGGASSAASLADAAGRVVTASD